MDLQKIRKAYTLFLQKHFKITVVFIFFSNHCFSQQVVPLFIKDSTAFYLANKTVTNNKIIPMQYADAVKIALLYYPELENSKIKIRVKKRLTPLTSRPTVWSTFLKPSKRTYIITISNHTVELFTPILLQNLSFNAQVGVLGHEISHIAEYNSKKGRFFLALALKHVSKKSMDKFEYNTDNRCIAHGLGYQLLSWSEEVRIKLALTQWGGANQPTGKQERYMNPATIKTVMKTMPMYTTK
jgi:hypothetical protein